MVFFSQQGGKVMDKEYPAADMIMCYDNVSLSYQINSLQPAFFAATPIGIINRCLDSIILHNKYLFKL